MNLEASRYCWDGAPSYPPLTIATIKDLPYHSEREAARLFIKGLPGCQVFYNRHGIARPSVLRPAVHLTSTLIDFTLIFSQQAGPYPPGHHLAVEVKRAGDPLHSQHTRWQFLMSRFVLGDQYLQLKLPHIKHAKKRRLQADSLAIFLAGLSHDQSIIYQKLCRTFPSIPAT